MADVSAFNSISRKLLFNYSIVLEKLIYLLSNSSVFNCFKTGSSSILNSTISYSLFSSFKSSYELLEIIIMKGSKTYRLDLSQESVLIFYFSYFFCSGSSYCIIYLYFIYLYLSKNFETILSTDFKNNLGMSPWYL